MNEQPILAVPIKKARSVEDMLQAGDTHALNDVCEPTGFVVDADLTAELQNYVLKRFPDKRDRGRSELDAFLAPRLHCLMRMPRQCAAIPGVWTWSAVSLMRSYMDHRWPLAEGKTTWRYTSRDVLRNGVARLWWAAELLRDGADYSLVHMALKSVRRFQFVSELKYSMHRECARAFTRVVAEADATDDECQELSKRFNLYLKAHALELWDYHDVDAVCRFDTQWASSAITLSELTCPDDELVGPSDGRSRTDVEEALYRWLQAVHLEAS